MTGGNFSELLWSSLELTDKISSKLAQPFERIVIKNTHIEYLFIKKI